MSTDAPENSGRLADGEDDIARLLSAMGDPEPPVGMEEALWRQLSGKQEQPVRRRWLAPALVTATAMAAALFFWPSGPRPDPVSRMVLALVSGEVELAHGSATASAAAGDPLAPGARLGTGANSRAAVRIFDAVVWLDEASRVELRPKGGDADVELLSGELLVLEQLAGGGRRVVVGAGGFRAEAEGTLFSVKVAADRTVGVRVYEGSVRVRGPSTDLKLGPGNAWFSGEAAAFVATPAREVVIARALLAPIEGQSVLRIEGAADSEVEVDGLWLGRPPLQLLAPAGVHLVRGRSGGAEFRGEAVIERGRPTLFRIGAEPPSLAVIPAGGERANPEPPAVEPKPSAPAAARPTPRVPAPVLVPEPVPAAVSASGGLLAESVAPSVPPAQAESAIAYQQAAQYTRAGQFAEAVGVYQTLASGRSRQSELALYELGRLRKRYLGDRPGALAAFLEYRSRFPRGALRSEVQLSIIETQLESASLDQALVEIEAFLGEHPGSERRPEVLLMRANVWRERGQCARALPEYLSLIEAPGATADHALYFAAFCERATGKLEAARARLEDYLARRPAGLHRSEASRVLSGE